MADALVSFVIEQLGTIMLQEVKQEVRLVVGVRKEVEKLTKTFKAIKAVIEDAEQRQIQDKMVKIWLEEFKEVAYDMEDVLDEWKTEILIRSQKQEAGLVDDDNVGKEMIVTKKVSSFLCSPFSCFSKIPLRRDIASRIIDIRERLDFIETERAKFQFLPNSSKTTINPDEGTSKQLETTSIIDVSEMCGRDLDKNIILEKLLGIESSSSNQEGLSEATLLGHLQIISIVGMGGLGKTTLAQLVFNDDQVKAKFEKTMWVCVSDSFDIRMIAKSIIQETGGSIPQDSSVWNNELHKALCACLKEKRFLLVLDDVWNEDENKWNPLKISLKHGAPGSRILVTTRSHRVASIVGTTYQHNLGILSDADCLSLFSRIAFHGRGNEECDSLRDISVELAKKCKGLPLAAKTLGSLLRFKKTEKEWLGVLESKIWELEEVERDFFKPALLLSYNDLSSPLKVCFQYCATFSKDCEIYKDELIKLWMAQGFLDSSGREDLASVGEEYFNNLAMRSFFQNFYTDSYKNIIACKMHDLVHDFAQFLMKDKCCTSDSNIGSLNIDSNAHHLTLISEDGLSPSFFDASTHQVKKLRTLRMRSSQLSPNLFHLLKCLRVIILNNSGLKSLPSEIEKLIHLRYLDLSRNYYLKELPESISNLYNLQTLNLQSCSSLRKLPKGIGRMINLRYLEIHETDNLKYLPEGIGRLCSLRSLGRFIVGTASEGCKIRELKNLNLLEGYLKINGFDKLETIDEASEAELDKKKHLNGLTLDFEDSGLEEKMEGVLGRLQPHPNLINLNICNYFGSKFPSWMVSNSILARLRLLSLINCCNCTELPALGLLPSLEELKIEKLDKLKRIGVEFFGDATTSGRNHVAAFPKLKYLYMSEMHELKYWDLGVVVDEEEEEKEEQASKRGGIMVMPYLTEISIDGLSKLKTFRVVSKLPSLEKIKMERGMENLEEFKTTTIAAAPEGGGEDSVMLPCLRYLSILGCPKLKSLPDHHHIPKLEKLSISIRSSSLSHLPNQLKILEIYEAYDLERIPEYVQHLTNLQKLLIIGCSKTLKQRCTKDQGEDWNIISHIPNIHLMTKYIIYRKKKGLTSEAKEATIEDGSRQGTRRGSRSCS